MTKDEIKLAQIELRWGKTHDIKRVEGTRVNLKDLADNESVCAGDMETYHFLLTEKQNIKN